MGYDELYILSPHFNIPQDNKETSINNIGQKAQGLLNTPHVIIPPFIIITTDLFDYWNTVNQEEAEKRLQGILNEVIGLFDERNVTKFIVRSSAKYESLNERGHYESSAGDLSKESLIDTIKELWYNNAKMIQQFPGNRFCTIIQQYITPIYSGHVSNERRISRGTNKFLLEVVDKKGNFIKSKRFSISKTKSEPQKPFTGIYKNKKDIDEWLKSVVQFLCSSGERRHIEWVADKSNIWLVQNDIEPKSKNNFTPGSSWVKKKIVSEKYSPNCFSLITTTNKEWKKTNCIKTFADCGLPYGDIYILDNADAIKDLECNVRNCDLVKDLEWLLQFPVTIRMDVQNADGYNNILLPRTETLFDIESTFQFLCDKSKEFISNGLKSEDFCFLIHRFIISKACALAFSKPGIPRARIDSTWGIVDGLYYHPHDSFEVNSVQLSIKKKIRCKTEFLDVNNEGNWIPVKASYRLDWKESLSKEHLYNIAEYNFKIANKLNSPVTVMYFVDVDKQTGYPTILPWFYTT
ncbi:MAG: hypothetical protein ACTHL3_03650, partial [Candidatus Nitrosocosmicus sp.]